jgi:glycosyltransferase involved in cell wall biosynthesis
MKSIPVSDLKIAIVHYYLISVRGGERCYHTLAQTFPQADLYSVVFDPTSQPEWLSRRNMTTSFLQKVPGSRKYFRQFFMFYPHAVEQFDLNAYDLVISSSAGFTHGVITPPETLHICYCYNPFRYAWNWYHDFLAGSNKLMRPLLALLLNQVRTWDIGAAQRPDHFVSISTVTQHRVAKYYRRESEIIYPPVELSRFSISETQDDYYLAFSELVPYKKMDVVVEAFNHLGKPLVVVGDGPQRDLLRKIAKPNISFRGRVSDAELPGLYNRARALIFMPKEDFGIIPLEAMASGRPVIAFGAGGALETVVNGRTGLFFQEQSAQSLMDAVSTFETMHFEPTEIRRHAQMFDVPTYQHNIRAFVRAKLNEHRGHIGLSQVVW